MGRLSRARVMGAGYCYWTPAVGAVLVADDHWTPVIGRRRQWGIDRRNPPPAFPALLRRAIRKSQYLNDSAKSARYSEKSLNISPVVEKPRDIEISRQPPRSVKVANR
ncbi:hypothetical protein BPORC_1838 [Bifidobacterium porcinum]|nr:hypothetical protein BPORC_1838 [Bifidobacterium porcinum]